jgi:thiol-disulfide isomerase/thioredoxin
MAGPLLRHGCTGFVIFLMIAPFARPARCADPTINWRTDYNTARKESQQTGLPILLQIGSENCLYCKKMDATTIRDPAIMAQLQNFIPLKVDGNREPQLVKLLKVQLYPTTVLAAPDGTIHAFIQGYVAVDQFKEQLNRTNTLVASVKKPATPPAPTAQAAAPPKPATSLLAAQSKSLLESARLLHKQGSYSEAWDICVVLENTPENLGAMLLLNEMRTDPKQLSAVTQQASVKAAALQLTLAEAHLMAGKTREAGECFDLAMRLNPNVPRGKIVEAQLTKLRGETPVAPIASPKK